MLSIHQQHPADFSPHPTCFPPNSTVVMASPISPAHSSYSVPSPFSSCSSASYPESTPSSERFVSSPDPASHNVVGPSNFLLTAHPTPPTLASASGGTHSTASSTGSSVSTDYNYNMMDWSKPDVTTAPKRPLHPHLQHPEHFQPNSVRYQSSRQQIPSQALPGDPQRLPDMSGIYMPPRPPSFRDEQPQQHPHHPSPVVIHSPVPIPVPSQIPQYHSPALTTQSPHIGGTNQHHVEQNPSSISASLSQADPGIFGVETDEWGSSHQQASPGNLEFASPYPQTASYSVTVAQRYPNPAQGRDLAPEFRGDMSDALNHASRSYHSPVVDEGIQPGTYGTQPQTQVPDTDVHSISQQRHVFDTSLPGQRLADAQSSPHEMQSPISPSYYPQVHMSYQQQSPTYSVDQPPQNLDEHAKHISSNYTVSPSEPPLYREVSSEGSYYQPTVDTRPAMNPGYVGEPSSSFTSVCAGMMSTKDAMSAANGAGDDRLVCDESWAQPLVNGRIYECETSRPDAYVADGVIVGTRVDAVDGEADAEGDEDVDIDYMARPVAAHINQSDESPRGQILAERRFSDSVKLTSVTAHEDAGNEGPESDTEDDDRDSEYLPGRSCRQLRVSCTSTFYPYGESKSLRSRFNPYPNYSPSVSPTSPTDPNMPFELDHQQQQHSFAGSSQATTAQDQVVTAQPRLRNRRSYSFPSVLPMGRSIDPSGSSSMSSAASTTTVRRRTRPGAALPIPVPVPNLTKKSRGRRVPTVDEFQAEIAAAAAAAGIPPGESHLGVGRKRNTISGAIGGTGANKGTRTYTCEVDGCGKLFARGEHLKRHVRSIHTYEKPHRCPYPGCGKDFSRHDNLGQHMRVHKDFMPPKNVS